MPSHYLNQCWNIVNLTLGNKLQWNLNRNSFIFIQENAFENNVWKMSAILSWPQCVNVSFHFLKGSLLKKGHDVLTTWRDRWFVLSHRALKYYISSEERDLKGTIPLSPRLKVEVSIAHAVRREISGYHPIEFTAQGQDITHPVRRETSRAPSHWVHSSSRVVTGLEKCLNFNGVLKKCLIFNFALKMVIFPGKVLENDNFILEK